MKYAEFITSLSIPKGKVNINVKKCRKETKCEMLFDFQINI